MGENRIDPDDAENAGTHNDDHRGRNALPKPSGGGNGAVHKSTDRIAHAHNTDPLHPGVDDGTLACKDGKELPAKAQKQRSHNGGGDKGVGKADEILLRFPAPRFRLTKLAQAV